MSRTSSRVLAAVAAGLLVGGPVVAADVRFDPSVDLSVHHDGNVNNEGERTSGDVGRLAVNLVLAVRNPASSWAFGYRPSREFNFNEPQSDSSAGTPSRRSQRDFTGHNFFARFTQSRSERTSVDARISYYRTERQEFDPAAPEEVITYLPRSTVQNASLGVGGSVAAGRRSSVTWGAGGGMSRREDVRDPDTNEIVFDYTDSETANATVGWAYQNSERSSVGGAYGFQRFTYGDPDLVGTPIQQTTTVHTASFNQSLTLGRDARLGYSLGVLRGTSGERTSNNAAVNLSVSWATGPRSSLAIGARQSASAGDGQSGASLDRGGHLSWSFANVRGFAAGANATYWDRRQLNPEPGASSPPSAMTFSDNVSFRVTRFLRMGAFHSYRRPDGPAYHSIGLFVNWLIRGERRAA